LLHDLTDPVMYNLMAKHIEIYVCMYLYMYIARTTKDIFNHLFHVMYLY